MTAAIITEYPSDIEVPGVEATVIPVLERSVKATKAQIRNASVSVQRQVKSYKYVLLVGNTPLQAITGAGGIKARRGMPFEQNGVIYLPTYSEGILAHDPSLAPVLDNDRRLFKQIIRNKGVVRETKVRPHLVTTWAHVDEMINALRRSTEASFDLETTGLYPWAKDADITMLGFGTKDGEFSVPFNIPGSPWTRDDQEVIVERCVKAIGVRVALIMQNGKFDCLWMLVKFGVRLRVAFDTMIAHYLIDENSQHGLKQLAQKYCGAPNWDVDKDTKRGAGSLEKLAMYHAHDLYYTLALKSKLAPLLKDDKHIKRVFDLLLMPLVNLFVDIEHDGVVVDTSKFDDAEAYLHTELERAHAALSKHAIIEWGSPKQLREFLFNPKSKGGLGITPPMKTPKGTASTAESALNMIDHPCVRDLIAFRGARQQLSFFIEGWKPFIHKKYVKGKWVWYLHPSFKLIGTVTGRLSCEHPNLQQIPRDPRIRTLIGAEDGWTVVECDLSQIELRIAAELSRDPELVKAFLNGIDVHWLTAIREIERGGALIDLVIDTASTWMQTKLPYTDAIKTLIKMGPDAACEINKGWSEYRKKAKAVNFGYLYGMWWKKFKQYARDNYGVTITDAQAEASRKYFFETYEGLVGWHKRQKRFVREHGYVRSLSGRKRRLPDAQRVDDSPQAKAAERQAINSPVQSFANDINLMALLQISQEFDRSVCRPFATVHDAILLRVRNDHVHMVTERLLEIMKRPALFDEFNINLTVPVLSEAKIGNWGAGIAFEKWSKANALQGK